MGKIHSVGISAPNSTYPQEIKNVEGINIASLKTSAEKVIGGLPFTIEEGIIKINGTASGTASERSFYFDSFRTKSKEAMFWIEISGYTDATNNTFIILQESNDNSTWTSFKEISLKSTSTHEFQVTLDSTKYYRIRFYAETNTFTNAEIKIQLEYGSIKHNFVPYNCIQIKKCNKNILSPLLEYGTINSTTGENQEALNRIRTKGYIDLSSSNTWTFSRKNNIQNCKARYYDKDFKYIGYSPAIGEALTKTLTLPENAKYLRFTLDLTNLNYITDYEVQIEEGSTATNYVAHAEKTYNFPLSEGQKLMQDGSIEDKFINPRKQVVFDGSDDEIWEAISQSTGGMYRYTLQKNDMENAYNRKALLCDRFISANNYTELSNASSPLIGIFSTSKITVCTDISTLADFRTWLSNNPILVEYPLITPDKTAFTPEQQAVIDEINRDGTYKEVTHYTAEASINPDIDAVGIINMKKVIQNLDARLTLVEE